MSMKRQVCSACGAVQYPSRDICRECLSDALEWSDRVAAGTVVALATLHRSLDPALAATMPRDIAMVQLEDGGPCIIAFADSALQAGYAVVIEDRGTPGQPLLHALRQAAR